MNEGLFLGAYKGLIFNFAQLSLVLYPAVYFANKNGSESKFLTLLTSYTLFDALFYPVDTLKNILYADTLAKFSTSLPTKTSRPSPTTPTSSTSTAASSSNSPTTCPCSPQSTAPPSTTSRRRPGPRGWQRQCSTR